MIISSILNTDSLKTKLNSFSVVDKLILLDCVS